MRKDRMALGRLGILSPPNPPLPDITKQAFNGIGATDGAVHDRREGIKRQEMLFIFDQAAKGFV